MVMIILGIFLIILAGITTNIYVFRGKHNLIHIILIVTEYLMGWFILTTYKSFCF